MNDEQRHPELRDATLTQIRARELRSLDSVTAVVEQRVRPDSIEPYERWLQEIVPLAARFPGHRGVNVIRPHAGSTAYTITIRFDSLAHAQDWFDSNARHELLLQAQPWLETHEKLKTVSGLEFWFKSPEDKPVPRYKQFILTLSAIYPLTMLVPALVRPAFEGSPFPGNFFVEHFASAAVVVALMVYLVMPRVTRLASRWLHA